MFNAIFGKEGLVASVDVVVKLLKTKCIPKLLYGLDACPVSSHQFRSLNHVVVSCARKICNVNTSEIAVVCIKMCGVNDIADAVAIPGHFSTLKQVYLFIFSLLSPKLQDFNNC